MTDQTQEPSQGATGRLDDEAEEREPSSTTDGPAAAGEYDPAQGSPDSGPHAPAEATPDDVPD
jgi:hypothetical protein